MSFALELKNVRAGYHDKPIFEDISFTVAAGEMTAILGPNGAGKTTLLRTLTGLLPPVGGEIRLFGEKLNRLPAAVRARLVGVVPQDLDTPMAFTVREMVMIGRTAALSRWSRPTAEDFKIIERSMVYTDVIDLQERPFSELSGGERQRAVIAMALAQQPKMLLMDEPTSHLDMNHGLEVMQIVERLNREQGLTVLMVSHDLNLAAAFCRRVLLIENGRLLADGPPATVLTEPILQQAYQCEVRVQNNPVSGSVVVTPVPRAWHDTTGAGRRIHVIAGGGAGEPILRALYLAGYTVTCGVLNQRDTDSDVATALGIECALEKPFSPISTAAMESGRALVQRAAMLVVSSVPFGPGNVINLELAEQAQAKGCPVFIRDDIESRDYTPDRQARSRTATLLTHGAQPWHDITDLMEKVRQCP